MKTLKRFSLLALCALMMLSLCACGSTTKNSGQAYREDSSYYSDYAVYDFDEAMDELEKEFAEEDRKLEMAEVV